jgi:hypothetical protein
MTTVKRINARRFAVTLAALVALSLAGFAGDAIAQAKSKSVQTEAIFKSYDPAAKTVTVTVKKAGARVKEKEAALNNGKDATFDVKPEGSVLTKTTVSINGRKGELTDIAEGKTLNIYWVVDESMSTKRFARKIDLLLSEEEQNERFTDE